MPETKEKKGFGFTLGADPEFIMTMQGRKVDASQTIDYMLSKKKEFKRKDSGFDIEPFGNIGWDGAASTAEIRPKPSSHPQEIVNNLAAIFKAFAKHVHIFDMSTISEHGPIGGHIHFEIPKGENWTKDKQAGIHRKLASFYIPIMAAENKTNLNLRIRQQYGLLGDHRVEAKFRYEDGSTGRTYEFRAPSAEWLTTPKIAAATLAYLGTVYNEILKHPKSFAKCNEMIYKSEKQGDAIQTLTLMEHEMLTNGYIKAAKKYIKKFEMYNEFKKEIEYILNTKKVIADKIKANYNIAQGWELESTKIPKKTEILSSPKKMKELAEKNDFDELKKVMNIHYNEDTNVAIFAETLKDRIAAFNWKLKNNYFIFGIRKGITSIICKNLKGDYLAGSKVLKTILDKHETDKLFEKMQNRFQEDGNMIQDYRIIDFKTGKPRDMSESTIIIGLPYDMRTKQDTKPFLEFIWELEKGTIKSENLVGKNAEELLHDEDLPIEQRGEIYKILTKQVIDPTNGVTFAQTSSNHTRAMEQIIDEHQRNGDDTPIVGNYEPRPPQNNNSGNTFIDRNNRLSPGIRMPNNN